MERVGAILHLSISAPLACSSTNLVPLNLCFEKCFGLLILSDQERFLDKSSQQQLISCFHQQFLLRSSRFKWAWELKMRPPILNPTGPGYARTVLISLPFYLCLSSKLYSPEVCVWILFKFQKISNKEDEITRREAHTHTHTHTFWRELQTKTHHIQSKSLRSGCKIGIFFSSYRLLIITRFKRDHFKKTKKDS